MCGPIALAAIGFITSAASSVIGYMGQMEQAKAMEKNASTAYTNDLNQLAKRQIQETDAANQKLGLMNIDEAERKGEASASAAGSGTAGVSVDAIMRDIGARGARNRRIEKRNLEFTVDQLQWEKKGSRASNQGRINSTPRPSPFSLIAGIGSAAANAWGSYNKYKVA